MVGTLKVLSGFRAEPSLFVCLAESISLDLSSTYPLRSRSMHLFRSSVKPEIGAPLSESRSQQVRVLASAHKLPGKIAVRTERESGPSPYPIINGPAAGAGKTSDGIPKLSSLKLRPHD